MSEPDGRCPDCEEWRKQYNAAVSNGHIMFARVIDRRLAAHVRAHLLAPPRPRHRPQSSNGCLFDERRWSEHTAEEKADAETGW